MNALGKKIAERRQQDVYLNMAETFIKAAILTADDIWGVTEDETAKFIKGFQEIVNGYGEVGVSEIDRELKERGITVAITG